MLAWKQTKAYSDKTCEAGTAPSASGKSIADATYVLCTDGLWLGWPVARMACDLDGLWLEGLWLGWPVAWMACGLDGLWLGWPVA